MRSRTTPPAPATTAPPAPPVPAPVQIACAADADVIDWRRGSLVTVTLANTGTADIVDPTVTLTLSRDVEVRSNDMWHGALQQDGQQLTVRPRRFGDDPPAVGVGEDLLIGFTASKDADDDAELTVSSIAVNGVACG